jgi:flagellin
MTRINTNISSLVAQSRLNRTNDDLQVALTRLSTGLRINTGKDDPAGLIASEALRSDITSINKAISNTQRAVQIIATADSALGQVSSLLNTMRGLIVEAANKGAISDDEIAANQLQIDSSLEAINRISQTTTFQGRKLLDGSLDFITDINTLTSVVDSKIDQANLGATGSMTVDISVQAQATQAQLVNTAFPLTNATATLDFPVRATNVLTDISVSASEITDAVTIVFQHSASVAADEVQAEYDPDTNTITVSGNEAVLGTITKAQVTSAINALPEFTAQVGVGAALDPAGDFTLGGSPPGNATLAESAIDIEADQPGLSFNQVDIVLQVGAATGAAYDTANKRLTITYVAGTDDIADIASAIDATAEFSVTSTSGGTAITSALDAQVEGNTDFTGGGVLLDHVVFELQGSLGAETFNFQAGTSNLHIAAAINQVSDATGVTAEVDATSGDIELYSSTWGSKSLVAINIITEGPLGTFRDNLSGIRDTGTDIVARVNGIGADGDGNQLSINTSTLSLQLTLDPDQAVNALSFSITGGGALFQLGGDVVTNQQARMGIGSMSTSTLGGPSGRLYELGSGQDKSLTRDMYGASRVIQEVINKVTGLRGRLGAFQATTLDSNMVSLTDTVGNLTEAESLIRDADFAKETARLTRAQILIQSGTAVLGISNQNPQNVLRLLQ